MNTILAHTLYAVQPLDIKEDDINAVPLCKQYAFFTCIVETLYLVFENYLPLNIPCSPPCVPEATQVLELPVHFKKFMLVFGV